MSSRVSNVVGTTDRDYLDDPVAKLKEEANIKFKAGEYSQANEVRFTIFLVHSLVDI